MWRDDQYTIAMVPFFVSHKTAKNCEEFITNSQAIQLEKCIVLIGRSRWIAIWMTWKKSNENDRDSNCNGMKINGTWTIARLQL